MATHGAPASVVTGAAWMVGLSLALFFMPAVNGLVGGFVGGYKMRSLRRALLAALLPAVIVATVLGLLFSLIGTPGLGVLAGSSAGLLILFSDLGLFVGAVLGAALGRSQLWGGRLGRKVDRVELHRPPPRE
jgi:hypothetical protein